MHIIFSKLFSFLFFLFTLNKKNYILRLKRIQKLRNSEGNVLRKYACMNLWSTNV